MSNNSSNQNPYTLYGGQNIEVADPNFHYPPPSAYYSLGHFYGQGLPAAAPSGAAAYLPSAAIYSVPPPQQSAYQVTGNASSSMSNQDDYFYSGGYRSSVEQQRESFVSLNAQNPPLPSQEGLSYQEEGVPLSSAVMSSSLPLACSDSSLFHQNVTYSTAQNLGFSSVHGDHPSPIQSAASMPMFHIPPAAHYMETVKQSGFPLPVTSGTLGQPGPPNSGQGISSSANQSGPLGVPPPLLMHSGPALTKQGGKKLRQTPVASQSIKSAPEISIGAQQSAPPPIYKQNCPPGPMQVKPVPVPFYSIPDRNKSLSWQNRSALVIKTGASLQMTNNTHLPHEASETPQQQCTPSRAYNDPQSASSADNPEHVLVPPYPPPPISGHTSTYAGNSELRQDSSPYKTGQNEKPWFQSVQQPSLAVSSSQLQSAGSVIKSTAAAHSTSCIKTDSASTKAKKTEERGRSWAYESSTQRSNSNEHAKDRSGRDNEHQYRPRSRSRSLSRSSSPSTSRSRNSGYRSRRGTRSPEKYARRDRSDESYSKNQKHTSSRRSEHSGNRDRSHSSGTTDGRRSSRTPYSHRRSRTPDGYNRSRSPSGRRRLRSPECHRARSSPDELSSRRLYRARKSNYGGETKAKPSTVVREEDTVGNKTSIEEQLQEKEKRRVERWDQLRKESISENNELQRKLEGLMEVKPEEILQREKEIWIRSCPSELHYSRIENSSHFVKGTPKLKELTEQFKHDLLERAERVKADRPKYSPPPRKNRMKLAKHETEAQNSSDSSSDESSTDEESCTMEELERKRLHPYRLHPEMWYNDPGEMNDGPLCRCSAKARRYGIRHGIYAGENHLKKCDPETNNADKLFHYRIMISPPTNFLTKMPTVIKHDEHEFIFEGFSMLSHAPLDELPTCKVIRFNIEYTILYIEEKFPENFTVQELDVFFDYLFHEILELVDLDFRAHGDKEGCPQFHFMPRFVRELKENGKEILSMNEVISYLLANSKPLIDEKDLPTLLEMPQFRWQNFADEVKGMVVTNPGMKPCSVRVDQLDRDQPKEGPSSYPEIVHFGIRPPQLSYAGNPEYQKAWREYVKFRHLLANMSKPSYDDKRRLESKEMTLQEMRTQTKMKRDVTVAVSAKGFHRTGIMCDIVQHAMLIPVLVCHLRFHRSCDVLEKEIGYKFKNRFLLQLALTHPSYRENFGTNPDHARNSLTNCGIRQPEYGDRRIHYLNTRKRGINTLINIMSRFGKKNETESNITHNERLEFLGDAVVEFLSSIHLFHIFPDLEEGGLATYRAAIVQNQHLAVLAKFLNLEAYMLYAHGSDLCHDLELRHAMANCFEALMGALFLDGEIEAADKVFGETLLKYDQHIMDIWTDYPPHPLQQQEPEGDRKWIPHFEFLQKLTKFEESTGIEFKHIRLLARAFTDRSIGYTNLTLGSNQRLEFLGDTVLQLIASEYLYKHFPEHHEGHLSLLRSSLVNNRTQAVVCDDLGMTEYAVYANPKIELKTKDRADLLEAFLGALYVDQGIEDCKVFCNVCFFPRLQQFIMNQDWNDPKSKLQQCCLTLRTMDGREPDIPVYKVIECKGPTNTRVYTVAVYFRGSRLAKASGHSIQQAEMNAAKKALDISHGLFPQLDHQKRVIAKSLWKQKRPKFPLHREWDDDRASNDRDVQRMPDSGRSSCRRSRETSGSPEPSTSTASIKEPGTSGGISFDNILPAPISKKKKKRNRKKKGSSESSGAPPSINPNL